MTSDEALIEKMAEAINEARLHQLATSTELARAALSVVRENDKMVQAGSTGAVRSTDLDDQLNALQPRRNRPAASTYLLERHRIRASPAYLAQLASAGTGPVYRLIQGRSQYEDADLDAWAREQISEPVRRAADARRRNSDAAA